MTRRRPRRAPVPANYPVRLILKLQATIIATVISAAVVSLFDWSQHEPIRREVTVQIKVQQTVLVKESAEDLQGHLDTYLGVPERTAQQTRSVRFDTPAQEAAFYQSTQSVNGLFGGVLLVSAKGKATAVMVRRASVVGIDVSDRDYFRQVMVVDQPTISVPLRNRVGSEPTAILAVPVHDQSGNLVGLIGAPLYLFKSSFLGDLRDMHVGQTDHVYLATQGDSPVYIVRPGADRTLALLDTNPMAATAFRTDPDALPERGDDVATR